MKVRWDGIRVATMLLSILTVIPLVFILGSLVEGEFFAEPGLDQGGRLARLATIGSSLALFAAGFAALCYAAAQAVGGRHPEAGDDLVNGGHWLFLGAIWLAMAFGVRIAGGGVGHGHLWDIVASCAAYALHGFGALAVAYGAMFSLYALIRLVKFPWAKP